MSHSETLELAIDLVSRDSVTPEDKGCQEVMIARLEAIGFKVERLRFEDVDNFWARRGNSAPLLGLAGIPMSYPPDHLRAGTATRSSLRFVITIYLRVVRQT